jgi:hypothetical protein
MKKIANALFATVSSLAALTVLAHSGHGVTPASSVTHYLVEPLHTVQAFAPLAFVAVTVWLLRRGRV